MTHEEFFALIGEVAYDLDQTHCQIERVCSRADTELSEGDPLVSEDAHQMLTYLRSLVGIASRQAQLVTKHLQVEAAPYMGNVKQPVSVRILADIERMRIGEGLG